MNYLRGKAGEKRGVNSEGNIEVSLKARSDVVSVEKAPKWSKRDMAGIDFVAHFAVQEDSGKVRIQEVPVQAKSSEHAVQRFAKKHAGEEIIIVNGQATWAGISDAIERQARNMGVVESERRFQKPIPGEVIQVFPDPQELKRAA